VTAPAGQGSRILVVGNDTDVSIALHLHLDRAGWGLVCLPTPEMLEPVLRSVAPHAIILMLPASPDASWGSALTTAASAARVGIRVIVVAPSRDVVEPLAAVAGAERALARSEVLARPTVVLEGRPGEGAPAVAKSASAFPQQAAPVFPPLAAPAFPQPAAPAFPQQAAATFPRPTPANPARPLTTPAPPQATEQGAAARPSRKDVDLLKLIDEELVDEPRSRPKTTRVEVNVSLVSEHNFYVGATRRVDSGGVFISTMLPPPVGTRIQVRLGLADGRKLDLEGEVVFIREKSAISGRQPSGCGVRLFGLPGWAIDTIDRFLLARPPVMYLAP
jgi:hypothetical protein